VPAATASPDCHKRPVLEQRQAAGGSGLNFVEGENWNPRDVLEGTDSHRPHASRWCMVTTRRAAASVAILAVLLTCVDAAQTRPAAETVTAQFHVQVWGEAGTAFTTRIGNYYDLRARLQHQLPAVTVTDNVLQIRQATRALARAIRVARPGAVQGEFFTAATGTEFKRVLGLITNAGVCAAIMDGNPGRFTHAIDGSYPSGKSLATMPGIVLVRLPPLPNDIEFRFVGRHLILYDVRANTIIDRLPYAIECYRRY
jgi:hypothetical protein